MKMANLLWTLAQCLCCAKHSRLLQQQQHGRQAATGKDGRRDSGAAVKDLALELSGGYWKINRLVNRGLGISTSCWATKKLPCPLPPTLEARHLYWRTGVLWTEPARVRTPVRFLVLVSRKLVCHEEWVILGNGLICVLMPLMYFLLTFHQF